MTMVLSKAFADGPSSAMSLKSRSELAKGAQATGTYNQAFNHDAAG
ncbi:MAG TPA: hypothetical protein VL326_01005 [Kofleriaceae bacterium]|jgi:hypothetical protein|nr:hypothetical protein [Kofleriaceae bacterium]